MRDPHFMSVRDLSVEFRTRNGLVQALDKVSLHVNKGEVLGIVGESGSGKSVTAFTVIGLLDAAGRAVNGNAVFDGMPLTGARESDRTAEHRPVCAPAQLFRRWHAGHRAGGDHRLAGLERGSGD